MLTIREPGRNFQVLCPLMYRQDRGLSEFWNFKTENYFWKQRYPIIHNLWALCDGHCFWYISMISDCENLLKVRSTYMQRLWATLGECKVCALKMESSLFYGMWKSKVKPKSPLYLFLKVWFHSCWNFIEKNILGSAAIWACDSHGQLYFKADRLAAPEVVDNAGGPMKHIEGQGFPNHHLWSSDTNSKIPLKLLNVAFLVSIMLVMYFSVLGLRKVMDQRVPTGNSKFMVETWHSLNTSTLILENQPVVRVLPYYC